jgi:hypothetical protein
MAVKTILDGQKLKTALDEFTVIGISRNMNRLKDTPARKITLGHDDMHFVASMHLQLFLMMCISRRRHGRNVGSQVFTNTGALHRLV